MLILCLIFEKPPYWLFYVGCAILHSHQQYTRVPNSPHPCQHLHPKGMKWHFIVVLAFTFLVISDGEYLFMQSLAIYILEKCLVWLVVHFQIMLLVGWFCRCLVMGVLYISWKLTPYLVRDLQIFSLIVRVTFRFVDCVLWGINFDIVKFIYFCGYCLCFWCYFQNSTWNPVSWCSSSMFSKSFWSFSSYIYVFDPFWSMFCVWCMVRVQVYSFAHEYCFPNMICWKGSSFSLCLFPSPIFLKHCRWRTSSSHNDFCFYLFFGNFHMNLRDKELYCVLVNFRHAISHPSMTQPIIVTNATLISQLCHLYPNTEVLIEEMRGKHDI